MPRISFVAGAGRLAGEDRLDELGEARQHVTVQNAE